MLTSLAKKPVYSIGGCVLVAAVAGAGAMWLAMTVSSGRDDRDFYSFGGGWTLGMPGAPFPFLITGEGASFGGGSGSYFA